MIKQLLLILIAFSYFNSIFSQQLPHYNQYRQFQSYLNPAAISNDYFLYGYNLSLNAGYRAQWISQPETPSLAQFSTEFIPDLGSSFDLVSGVTILQESLGPLNTSGIHGRLGSLFAEDPYWGAFSIGLSFGMVEYSLNAEGIVWKDQDDPLVPLNNFTRVAPDFGLGIYYYKRLGSGYFNQDNIYGGISIPQLFSANLTITSPNGETPFRRLPHIYAMGGWYHFFNESTYLETAIWLKYTSGVPLNVDFNGRLQLGPTFWFGGGIDLNGFAHLEGGVIVPELFNQRGSLKIGYGFDYSISAFDLNFGATHELILTFNFDTLRY